MLEVLGDVLAWPPNDDEETALEILARTPSAFAGKSSTTPKTLIDMCFGSNTINMQHNALKLTKFLCETMTSDQRKSYEETTDHASKLLFEAARFGNYNFLTVLVGFFPDLIFRKDEKRKSIFHIAVLHRHAGIFTHIHNLGLRKDLIMLYRVNYSDQENPIVYNMLHLAAKLPSLDRLNIVSGAALQMQRELLWFKEVENLTPPSEREMRDSKDELTPQELFTKEHEELRKAGETWMKKTAEAGMIVATIITTVVFTTASSLPGGTDGGDGSPKNKDKTMFHVFAVADSVAMCSSIVSTMMFLSILTSRYAEKDFLVRLPLKLAAAVTTLLVSMMALMVSFSAIYFLVYCQSKLKWVPILASALSFLPAALFVLLQYHLLPDVFRSAFGSRYIFRPNKSTFWESFNKIFNENVSN
ncbi:PREDICTED: uncharacterized protein LOC18587271 isoform X1 [Theobroma cacao]|uniref:Uncharacterized protein LOC18587271 isoform X1 n=1 Tax=Theobroma cacao TaxID=3641 RepID=A0AB32X2C2_THECC|nr:PREDICTED: uncharacterized protein LOC18587271 isoform X1 [Theobroma cacao]